MSTEFEFLAKLAKAKLESDQFQQVDAEKAKALDDVIRDLKALEPSLRSALAVSVLNDKGKAKGQLLDARGMDHEIDTEDAVASGLGLSAGDFKKAQVAWKGLIALGKQLEASAFSQKEITDELYTPLVRRGVIPENLVPGRHSEMQALLDGTYAAYAKTLVENRKVKQTADAEASINAAGADGALAKLKAIKHQQSNNIDNLKIVAEYGELAIGTIDAIVQVKATAEGRTWEEMETMLGADEGEVDQAMRDLREARRAKAKEDRDKQVFPLFAIAAAKLDGERADALARDLDKALYDTPLDLSADVTALREVDWVATVEKSVKTAVTLIKDALIGIAEPAVDVKDAVDALDETAHSQRASAALRKAVAKIDSILTRAFQDIPAVNSAFAGAFTEALPLGEVVTIVSGLNIPENKAQQLINLFAAALGSAIRKRTPAIAAFQAVAKAFEEKFPTRIGASNLAKLLNTDPEAAAKKLIKAASFQPSKDLLARLAEALGEDGERAMALAGVPTEDEVLSDLETAAEEAREYERRLVLIDEGGLSAAEQSDIETLIQKLKKDRQVLELAANIGATVLNAASGSVEIANAATDGVTDLVAGQVTSALKAARLVMKLAVNIKKAADRWNLWYTMRKNLARARNAASPLSSTIEGFRNNKKEQIAFHTIEDALLAVQLAGAVLGSIPEPLTFAIGKTMSAVSDAALAANTIVGRKHNEKELKTAWATTRAALDNPDNRKLGRKALKLNPTLGMHAIAWAGLERRDPIARMVLDSVGLNEQTLEGSGTEHKVRDYLKERLGEDRVMDDDDTLSANWMPSDRSLTKAAFFMIVHRAQTKARPKLEAQNSTSVLSALKKIEAHDLDQLDRQAFNNELDAATFPPLLEACDELEQALKTFSDGLGNRTATARELQQVCSNYRSATTVHRERIEYAQYQQGVMEVLNDPSWSAADFQ